jgi:aryl-alcohol dehydrogenase-like predicted oxidoreductase
VTELVLGTAQLGFEGRYGITNTAGRLTPTAVRDLLTAAVAGGIRTFDTAEAYGDAEEQLGALMPEGGQGVRYITKFGLRPEGPADVSASIGAALERLAATRLHGVLLHRVDDVDDPRFPDVLAQLRAERDVGRVARIGVSVYDVVELERCIAAFPDFDILSFSGSIVDRRLLDHPLVADLHAGGVECHVRSVFLQGLLLASPEQLPERFATLGPVLRAMDEASSAQGADRIAWALAGARRDWVDGVTVGATSARQLAGITTAWRAVTSPVRLELTVADDVLDPRRW